jgi:hypothetical protein
MSRSKVLRPPLLHPCVTAAGAQGNADITVERAVEYVPLTFIEVVEGHGIFVALKAL